MGLLADIDSLFCMVEKIYLLTYQAENMKDRFFPMLIILQILTFGHPDYFFCERNIKHMKNFTWSVEAS